MPNLRHPWLLTGALFVALFSFAARSVVAQEREVLPPTEGFASDSLLHLLPESDANYSDEGSFYGDVGCGDGVCGDPYCEDQWCDGSSWGGGQLWDQFCEKHRFRHSSTHGRWTGRGQPLRTTSWLNRPYEFGLDFGGFLMANRISPNNERNNDLLAAAHLGWDWDHYWGTQIRVAWTTPEMANNVVTTARTSNNVFIYDLSMMYYPWGDSRVRPYYRFGLGLTEVDFINPNGVIEDNTLFSMPLGVGIKYQTQRWMALRAELVDYITWGQNSASSMQNFTLTFGMEWRYGGRPANGWSSPSKRHVW